MRRIISSASVSVRSRGKLIDRAAGQAVIEILEKRQLLTTVVVNSSADGVNDANISGSSVTLREAVNYENANGGGTISVDGPVMLSGTALEISSAITIQGSSEINANNQSQVFQVDAGAGLTLEGVTVTGGETSGYGGGISNSGTVTLIDDTLTGNSAGNGGGAIANTGGTLTIEDSTIAGNSSAQGASGIELEAGSATVTGSIIADGVAGGGFSASSSHNVFGPASTGGLTTTNSTANVFENSVAAIGLGTLSSSAGNVPAVFPLLTASPAIGAGVAIPGVTLDERLDQRDSSVQSAGAFQVQVPTITGVTAASDSTTPGSVDLTITGADLQSSNVQTLQIGNISLPAGSFSVLLTAPPAVVPAGYYPSFYITATLPASSVALLGSGSVSAPVSVQGFDAGVPVQSNVQDVSISAASGSAATGSSATSVTIQGPATAVGFGYRVPFTATVAGQSNPTTPTGTVQFEVNGVAEGLPVALVNGIATYTTTALTNGNYTITAIYNGDSNFASVASQPFVQSIGFNPAIACPPGTFSDNGKDDSTTQFAPAGSISTTSGDLAPILANAGSFAPGAGYIQSVAAPPGFYIPYAGATWPIIDQPGHMTLSHGSQAQVPVPKGIYAPGYGTVYGISASPGYFVPSNGASAETPASPGYYVPTSQAFSEIADPPGMISGGAAVLPTVDLTTGTPLADSELSGITLGYAGSFTFGSAVGTILPASNAPYSETVTYQANNSNTAPVTTSISVMVSPSPTVTRLIPSSGPVNEGTQATLSGTGFQVGGAGSSVTIDGVPTQIVSANASSITFVIPSEQTLISDGGIPALNNSVVVTDADGSTSTSTGFSYSAPVIFAFSPPTVVDVTGGESISVTGANLLPADGGSLTVEGVNIPATVNASLTQVQFTAPALAPLSISSVVGSTAFVPFTVENPDGAISNKEYLGYQITGSLVVNTTDDTNDPAGYLTGHNSLRDAINYAQSLGGSQTITFAPSLTAGGPATITLTQTGDNTAGPSALGIDSNVTIDGPTSGNGITLAGNGTQRLFYVAASGTLSLDDLTLTGGSATGGSSDLGGGGGGMGGAIFSQGSVNILQSTLVGNTATGGNSGNGTGVGGGGGMGGNGGFDSGGGPNGGANFGSSGFGGGGGAFGTNGGGFGGGGGYDGDSAGGFGGGGGLGGTASAAGFGGGSKGTNGQGGGGGAGMGGAIFNAAGALSIIDSTLSTNQAAGGNEESDPNASAGDGFGGAVFNLNGNLTLTDDTFDGNAVVDGTNAKQSSGNGTAAAADVYTLGLSNVVAYGGGPNIGLANGTASASLVDNLFVNGTVNGTAGTELVLNNSSGNSTATGSNNLDTGSTGLPTGISTTVAASVLDLGALGNNGGTTQTFAPLPGSPAISEGLGVAGITTDQRGDYRSDSGATDIGAYQNQTPVIATVSGGTTVNGNSTIVSAAGGTIVAVTGNELYNSGVTSLALTIGNTTIPITNYTFDPATYGKTLEFVMPAVAQELSPGVMAGTLTYSDDGGTSNAAPIYINNGSLIVNTTDDNSDPAGYANGDNSLRDAIAYANALSGPAVISFDSKVFASRQVIDLSDDGELTVTNPNVYIDSTNGVLIEASTDSTIFTVDPGAGLSLTGFTLAANDTASQSGSGGWNRVTNTNSNSGSGNLLDPPAILNQGSLALDTCTFAGNSVGAGASSISTTGGGFLTADNCTFSNNAGDDEVDIAGTATVNDCTFSGNSDSGAALLVRKNGSLTLNNSIVDDNVLQNTGVLDGTNNLITDGVVGTGVTELTNPASGSLLLAPLAFNGGPSPTMALLPGSAAIAAGIPIPGISFDETGYTRSTTAPSIGAYENEGFSITATGGSGQSAVPLSPFETALGVQVTSNNPLLTNLSGGMISFAGPGTGAGATFGTNPITLAADGTGSTVATANGTPGSYSVTATAGGVTNSATFSLSNAKLNAGIQLGNLTPTYSGTAQFATVTTTPVPGLNYTITYTQNNLVVACPTAAGTYAVTVTIEDATYQGTANGTLVIAQATPTISITAPNQTYTGSVYSPAVSVTGVGGVSLGTPTIQYFLQSDATQSNPLSAPTSGGRYTILVTYSGSTDYIYTTASANFCITPAPTTLSIPVVPQGGFINNPVNVSAELTFGTGPSTAVAGASITFTLTRLADGTVTSTLTAPTNSNGLASVIFPSSALQVDGPYTVAAVYNGNSSFGGDASGAVGFGVYSKAILTMAPSFAATAGSPTTLSATLSVVPTTPPGPPIAGLPIVFTFSDALGKIGTATGSTNAAGVATVSPSFSVAELVNVTASFYDPGAYLTDPTGTFPIIATTTSSTVQVTATPSVSVCPIEFTYGTKLSNTQLTGSASYLVNGKAVAVSGTFGFTNAAGTLLSAGKNQTEAVTFTPTDGVDFTSASTTVAVNVDQASAQINISGYTGTYDGTAHGASGTAVGVLGENLAGLLSLGSTFTNVPGGAASWSFAGNTNYKPASGTVSVIIAKASSNVTVVDTGGVYSGAAFNATGGVSGAGPLSATPTFTYTGINGIAYNSSTGPNTVGTYTVTAAYAGDTNHNGSSSSATFAITAATPTLNLTAAGGTYNASPFNAIATVTGVNGTSTSSLEGVTPTLTYYSGNAATGTALSGAPTNAGTYTVLAKFPGSADYRAASASKTFTITQSGSTLSVPAVTVAYGGTASLSATLATLAGTVLAGRQLSFTFNGKVIGTALTNSSGTATLTASVAGIAPGVLGAGVVVSFAGDGNSTASSASASVTVKDAAIVACGTTLAIPILPIALTLGSFTQARSGALASDYVVTVNWGDGSAAQTAAVVADPLHSGQFDIVGPMHIYASILKSYTVTVTISTVAKFGVAAGATTSFSTAIVA